VEIIAKLRQADVELGKGIVNFRGFMECCLLRAYGCQ
jgi:hypothetical protein